MGDSQDVTFAGAGVTLAGELSVPDADTPVPGVVMVGGSGPSDRHNGGHFPAIRAHLVDAGIAVLSYDKRGVGGSSGDWRDSTLDDLAADAAEALDFLRGRTGVRAEVTGLFGHSEGGGVVLRATTLRDDVPWVVTNGTPGMVYAAQDRYAVATWLRGDGMDDDGVAASLAAYDRVVEAGRRDADLAEATRRFEAAPIPPGFVEFWSDVDDREWRFIKRKLDHDPIPDALRLRCPQLVIFGGADQLVPAAESVELFTAAATHPDRDRRATLTVEVFPGANHRVLVDGVLAPGYLDALTRWITAHTNA
ncbi:alpha/beta hydrolase [Actinosynnema sp. NPDC023658]|uniref:alpha/beta hydrolase family protein n=1 Tax=Actinosynnema sp. NPDC023658 TaxID=3155465 RepID=UPI00340FFD17